jgi:methyl-accepting chemotaxis protein
MDTTQLFEFVSRSFRDLVATLLTDEPVPTDFQSVLDQFKTRKSDLGRKEIAQRVGLNVEELGEFERNLSELAKRNKQGLTGHANDSIACLRLLSWMETIEGRQTEYQLEADVDPAVSEDLSRKQVRALELVIRSLVGERHGDQAALANHLRDIFGERTVDRWAKVADAEDLLSGTTFSELASIFVNKDEFTHHQKLYEDADVANLLAERRKTIQTFLEDIRRVRNTLAHNKKVSPIQLSLLDLYYDQLISPVQAGFSNGQTQVNPKSYLQATDEQVRSYFGDLKQDVISVKDDISELRSELSEQFEDVRAQGREVVSATRSIDKKLIAALALLIPIGLAVGYVIYMNTGTNEQVVSLARTTESIKEGAESIDAKADSMLEEQAKLGETADTLVEKTNEIAATASRVDDSTQRLEKSSIRMEKSNEKVLDSVSSIAESNERIAQSIENIQDGFQSLSKAGGIIDNPSLPQEVYHNARVYEQRGDYGNARKSYVKFFDYELDLVDPHFRFQSFLKLQEGLEGARDIYRTLQEQHENDATEFAALLLEPSEKRTAVLATFADEHPDFGPAFYALSQQYSSSKLGTQDVGDMADEKKYLERFLDLKEQGEFVKYMLDKSLADEQLKDARQRLTQLSRISDEAMKNPVSLSGMMSNSGWMITIQVTGSPKEILYRTDSSADFKTTGYMQYKNPTTGNLMPNMTVNLDKMAGPTTFEVKYIDANDRERGPFKIEFEPASELVSSQKKILEMLPQSWVSFRNYDGKTLVYFTHLLSYRSAIKEIWYGLDKDEPDTRYKVAIMTPTGVIEHAKELDQGDPKNPHALGENEMPFFSVPGTTEFITVKLDYLDGTQSEIVRIKR